MLLKIILLSIIVWFIIGSLNYIFVVLCKSGQKVTQNYMAMEFVILMVVSIVSGPTTLIAAFIEYCRKKKIVKNQ